MFPLDFDVYEITLRLRIDRDNARRPEKWDWYSLLDLGSDEYVQVIKEDFIGRSMDIVDEYAPEYEEEDE